MAAGDIALTTPRTAANVNFRGFHYYPVNGAAAVIHVDFVDDLGKAFTVVVANGECLGFNASTGAQVRLTLATELTLLSGDIFKTGALTNGITRLRTDGLIVAPGTIG